MEFNLDNLRDRAILTQIATGGGFADPYGPELHTFANAASDPNGNEANATTGWAIVNDAVLTSVGTPVDTGGYALYVESNTVPASFGGMYVDLNAAPFNLKDGDNVRLAWSYRHDGTAGSDAWASFLASSPAGFNLNIDTLTNIETTYQEKNYEFVHDVTTKRYWNFHGWSGSNSNGGIYVDNISVKLVL